MTNFQLSIHFFVQVAAILATCRVVGLLVRRLGQPQGVGEMIAGVLLGPSLLGWAFPDAAAWLFPRTLNGGTHPLMTVLYCVAQLGLVLYMFVMGVEFDVGLLRQKARSAVTVSAFGIVVPMALGAGLAWVWYGAFGLFTEGASRGETMLFMGAAMSITAFPMLARIIFERGMSGTAIGTLALAAGATDDALAWCILAVVLASFKADVTIAAWAVGGGVLYAVGVLTLVRPALAALERRALSSATVASFMFPLVLVLLMLGAWYTDWVGIYAVFGAFILGMAMPRGEFASSVRRRIEPLTVSLLLPFFFVNSGLNTRLSVIDTWSLAGGAAVVLACACIGKGVACYIGARIHGEGHRDAAAVGALMNSRGLMELIIINIGLERGLISTTLFSILVIMAIVTTLMATPLFELFYRGERGAGRATDERGRAEPPLVHVVAAPAPTEAAPSRARV